MEKKQKILKKSLLFLALILFAFNSSAQNRNITGKVTGDDGMGIPGVAILVKGTTEGTITNQDGIYSIDVTADAVLVFRYIGYSTQEKAVGSETEINIALELDAENLEEVVVVGYGTQRKSDITGSVASISSERLEMVPNTNIGQAIQGAIPGVSIVSNSAGAEGNDNAIIIRGRNSMLASNRPLIVLDGSPYNGSLSEINPTDIASIEVLKDGSASAIYGSRGANGVILVTSKKGKSGKPSFTYDGYYGIQTIADMPDMMTGEEFYEFKNIREPGIMTTSEEEIYQSGTGVNWLDLATQNGYKQQHSLSVSGGTEKVRYYMSGSYLDVKGVAVNDLFKRTSVRINLDVKITKWLTFATNSQLSSADRGGRAASWGGDGGAFSMNPLTSSHDENGQLTVYPWPEDNFFGNPLEGNLVRDSDKSYKVFTNNYIKIDFPFVPGLSYKLNTGIEYTHRARASYYGMDTKTGFESLGSSDTRTDLDRDVLVENILSYSKEFGKHNIFLTGLYSYQGNKETQHRLEASGFPNDVLTWYQGDVASLVEPSYEFGEFTILSSMLRANYAYDNRYLITLTARRDGYSGFGDNTKWGNFPSVALGWNIANESFMPDLASTLKLRLSYGQNGNQAVDPYESLARMSTRSYLDGGLSAAGYYPNKLGTPDLGWESTTSLNIGIDYGLFNDRVHQVVQN